MHPTTITFSRSDADPSQWPVCGRIEPGVYLDRLSPANEYVIHFRKKLASKLSDLLNYPPETGVVVNDLPEGYGLFCRRTITDSKTTRQDRYLRGSYNVKQFRSAAEFAPHAAWLLTDISLDPSNCQCQYCCKKVSSTTRAHKSPTTQAPVSSMGVDRMPLRTKRINRTASSLSHTSSRSAGRPPLDIYLRRVQPLSLQVGPQVCPASPSEETLYRSRELVWMILQHPISVDAGGKNYIIQFWPGIVEQHNIIVPSPTSGDGIADSETHYQIKILSLNRTYNIPRRFIAPFQAHSADEIVPPVRYNKSCLADLHNFDPFPQWSTHPNAPSASNQPNAEFILASLLFDIKVTRMIASFWSVTETRSPARPVDIRDPVPPSSPRAPDTTPQPHDTSPPSPTIAESDPHRGLWWGAESIQPGDLLRLSFTESRFTYTGAASACFANDLPTEGKNENPPVATRNRSRGCMFLELRALIPIQKNESRTLDAVGQLYKLVPAISGAHPEHPGDRGEAELPPPPEGYAFCRILTSDWEVQLSLGLVRGKYYPRLKGTLGGSTGFSDSLLQTMEGLATCATMTPRYNVTESREEMIEHARVLAS